MRSGFVLRPRARACRNTARGDMVRDARQYAQAGTSERSSPVAGAGNNNAEDGIEARGNSQPAFVKVIRRVSDPGF
jgi:hypothetical protein